MLLHRVLFEVLLNYYFFSVWYQIMSAAVLPLTEVVTNCNAPVEPEPIIVHVCSDCSHNVYIHQQCCSIDNTKLIHFKLTSVIRTIRSARSGLSFWHICIVGRPSKMFYCNPLACKLASKISCMYMCNIITFQFYIRNDHL